MMETIVNIVIVALLGLAAYGWLSILNNLNERIHRTEFVIQQLSNKLDNHEKLIKNILDEMYK